MDAFRQYLFSVITASVICAFFSSLCSPMGKRKDIVKLICGLFLTLTVIRPIADIRLDDLASYTISLEDDAQAAIASGREFAQDSLRDIIKEETEAYILDKAQSMDAHITAEVILTAGKQPLPEAVFLRGKLSSAARQKLQAILSEDLGIAKENQIWIQ